MADVKWIKITTNMFDDEKIDFISSLPEGHSIFYIWIRLLTMAGRCNAGGYIFLTEKIPYTDDALASRFKMNLNIVRLALETLSRLEMIDIDNKGIRLVNWDKYQNVDRLDKLREYDRERKRLEREKAKQIPAECPADNPRNSGGLDIDKDIDIDKEYTSSGVTEEVPDEELEKSEEPVPWPAIRKEFNETCVSLPKVRQITGERKKHLGARLKELDGNIEKLYELFREIEASDFLTNREKKNRNEWKADFDWIINQTNFNKILEGKYKNKDTPIDPKEWGY